MVIAVIKRCFCYFDANLVKNFDMTNKKGGKIQKSYKNALQCRFNGLYYVLFIYITVLFSFMFQPSQRGMRPLSVLRTSFPIKGQEAVVAWKFSLGLSALAFPAPSRGRMPARQEGVFTKRLSDKQYIMKAESLLEHKCFFSGFCFYRTAIIHLRYLSEAYINGKYR